MSTSFDYHCVTCGEESSIESAGWEHRDGESLDRLMTLGRPALETIGMLLKDHWQLTTTASAIGIICDFFGRHAGHEIEVRDEYGSNMKKRRADHAAWEAARRTAEP